MKDTRLIALGERLFLESLVFETLGEPAEERFFRYRDLRRCGFDLLSGRRAGTPCRMLAPVVEGRKAGDRYEIGEETFEVEEVLLGLPLFDAELA